MNKIFGYELKRFLLNKFTAGLLLVIGFYSYWVMQGEVILGISNTAPFSPWSFGMYLARVLPLLLVALLFFVSFLYSEQAKALGVLTDATPVKRSHYRIARYGAITAAFLLLCAVPVVYACALYGITFRFNSFQTLFAPLVFTLLPAYLLTMGLGALAGRLHPVLVFALMPLVLLLGALPLPAPFDLYGTQFFASYPATLGTLDPVFQLPAFAVVSRVIYAVIGLALLAAATVMYGKRKSRQRIG